MMFGPEEEHCDAEKNQEAIPMENACRCAVAVRRSASLLLIRMVGAVVYVVLCRFWLGLCLSHVAHHVLHHSLHHVLHHGALALLHLFDVSADLRTKLGQLCRI